MKKLLTIIGLFSCVLLLSGCDSESLTEKTVEKPQFESLVLNNRSYCQKQSEIAFSIRWDKLCEQSGKPAGCKLPESSVKSAQLYQELSFKSCSQNVGVVK